MKKTRLTLLFILITFSILGQDDVRIKALSRAQEVTKLYNKRELHKYVDYLLPVYYGNDDTRKEDFTKMWEVILKQDTANFEITKLVKLSKSGSQHQALFQGVFRNNINYMMGISDDNGSNWKFTTFFNKKMKFDQLLKIIPSLNHSFVKIVDPKFGDRISYKIGETIQPFNFIDVNGNKLSSKALESKAIVLNFWGVGCAPCIKEIPELNKLVEKYHLENVKFIALAAYSPEETINDHFLPKHPFLYDIVVIDGDDYVISSYPTHVIINQNHEVTEVIVGYSEENIQKLENAINKVI